MGVWRRRPITSRSMPRSGAASRWSAAEHLTMPSQHLSLSLLFRVLPRTAELAGLREAILVASASDPQQAWRGSSESSTVDDRVTPGPHLDAVSAAAIERSLEHVRTYHRRLRDAMRELADGADSSALNALQEAGQVAADAGQWEACISYYG